jgi:hypothetical protein
VSKQGHKQCLQAVLTSRTLSRDTSTCTYVRTDVLTKKLLTLSRYLTFVNVREVSANA